MFRLITFASAHPRITDGQRLSTQEIVELLLHGISAGKPAVHAENRPVDWCQTHHRPPDRERTIRTITQPVGAR